jgi:hypothetical protein
MGGPEAFMRRIDPLMGDLRRFIRRGRAIHGWRSRMKGSTGPMHARSRAVSESLFDVGRVLAADRHT